uniref:THAP-type domain-containing protein n=1 Tax=Magallana gigas TaxID=29159 RepID=A0A8W8JNN7_MAGGI
MPYEKGGGRHCVVFNCSNNQRKLYRWKMEECFEHGKRHEDCPCQAPFRLFWIPAQVCSIHFLDGCPTKLNPDPQLHMGYHKEIKQGRRKLVRNTSNQEDEQEQDEESGLICIGGDEAAAEATDMEINTPSVATASTQTPPVIVHQYGVSCVTYRPKSDATTQTIDSLHDHLYCLQLTSNTHWAPPYWESGTRPRHCVFTLFWGQVKAGAILKMATSITGMR